MAPIGALSWAVGSIRRVPIAQRHLGTLALEAVAVNVPGPGKPSVQGAKSGTHGARGPQVPHSRTTSTNECMHIRPTAIRAFDCEAANAVQEPGCRLRHQTESPCPVTHPRFTKFPMVLGMGPVSWLLSRRRNLPGKCRATTGGGGTRLRGSIRSAGARMQAATPNRVIVPH